MPVRYVSGRTPSDSHLARETFTLRELDAAVGDYIVGFIVEDLDGNQTSVFTRLAVE